AVDEVVVTSGARVLRAQRGELRCPGLGDEILEGRRIDLPTLGAVLHRVAHHQAIAVDLQRCAVALAGEAAGDLVVEAADGLVAGDRAADRLAHAARIIAAPAAAAAIARTA